MPRFRIFRTLSPPLLAFAFVLAIKRNDWWPSTDSSQESFGVENQNVAFEDDEGYTRHIVAVGDLHSDYGNALKVLQMADVVDGEGNWTGHVDLFVQTGDIIDRYTTPFLHYSVLILVLTNICRGIDTIKLYLWMEKLRDQARTSGGDVVSHLGNHEWMNLLGVSCFMCFRAITDNVPF